MSELLTASVAQLDLARSAAMVAADMATLDRLLDDRFAYIHSSALTDDKASLMGKIADGTFTYRRIDRANERAVLAGDACLLFADLDIDIRVAGTDRVLRLRTLTVWTREAGTWRTLSFQSTSIPS